MEWLILIGIGIYIFSKLSNTADKTTTDVSDEDLSDFRIVIETPMNRTRAPISNSSEPAMWIEPGQKVKIKKI